MHTDNEKNKGGFSRRDFVKSTAILAGGTLLSQLPVEASAYVAGDDTIKVAVIGCGGRGTGAAAQALSTQGKVKLVAMADAFRDRLDPGDAKYWPLQKKPKRRT
jgi:hypothetical protein